MIYAAYKGKQYTSMFANRVLNAEMGTHIYLMVNSPPSYLNYLAIVLTICHVHSINSYVLIKKSLSLFNVSMT